MHATPDTFGHTEKVNLKRVFCMVILFVMSEALRLWSCLTFTLAHSFVLRSVLDEFFFQT